MNKNKKILIVDDAEIERIQLQHILCENFLQENLFFAARIEEAWEILKNNQIDLLLLDIYLPGENGADLMSNMFADEKLKNIPIIVITGTREDSFVKHSFEKYVHAYLHKPVDKVELFKAIESSHDSLK
ncbi:MAG: response regulator transcription factor [Vicingus serpentipes]|nr:response regulator transcription factor [Vicingus serpentipes]